MAGKNKTDAQIQEDRSKKIMEVVAWRAGYYRCNPHRFVEDFIGIHLKLFQKIILWAMNWHDMFYFIACRGLSKTYMVALFAVMRCILYPGQQIICVSATYKQGREIVLKITDDFMHKSPLLCQEILKTSIGQNDCYVTWRNGSILRVVTASENARGARAHILIVDESRLVRQKIVDDILRPMNAAPRQPGYLSKPEYKGMAEMNKELYLSSAWYQQSEMFSKVKDYFANSLNDKLNYWVCDLPYQLAIKEGILMRQTIENRMSEKTFSDISFMMEYEGKFYGSGEDSLFNFSVLDGRRVLKDSLFDLNYYRLNAMKPPKKDKTVRILSVDIALLASKKHNNDASAFIINDAVQTTGLDYISNIVYVDTKEGLVTEEIGLAVMRYFYQYRCDYMVLDCNGVGQSILDYIMQDRYDPEYGCVYDALTCCNNPELAERCKIKTANKVVYAIKASAKQNNDMCLALRAGFLNGNINLLLSDNNIEEVLSDDIKGYKKLNDNTKDILKLPYIQTSFLIDELINLRHSVQNGLIKVYERSGMRKDRYSSLEYNYYVTQELARNLRPKTQDVNSLVSQLTIRRGYHRE